MCRFFFCCWILRLISIIFLAILWFEGYIVIFLPLFWNVYKLDRPWSIVSWSNNQGLPSIILPTSIGITSHHISSWYDWILIGTKHLCLNGMDDMSIQATLYGLGWSIGVRSNHFRVSVKIALMQLPLSMITLYTLSPWPIKVWKMKVQY